jgi:hypothetical protein
MTAVLGMFVVGSLAPAAAQATLSSISGIVTLDGAPVVDARIVASGAGFNRSANTAADGSYTIANLPDGEYSVNLEPTASSSVSPSWVYTGTERVVVLPPDATAQDFAVSPAPIAVVGSLQAPDGASFAAPNRAWVRAQNQEGQGNSVQVAADGSFRVNVLEGAILLRVTLENTQWDAPSGLAGLVYFSDTDAVNGVVMVDGDPTSAAIDPLVLGVKSATIAGRVTTLAGVPAPPGIPVLAWRVDGAEYAQGFSDSEGAFRLAVIPGAWFLRAQPLPAQDFVAALSPQRVLVAENETVTRNLQIAVADVLIEGRAVDSASGTLLGAGVDGVAYSTYRAEQRVMAGPSALLADGVFSLKLASSLATTYTVGLHLTPESGYTALSRVSIALSQPIVSPLEIPVAVDNSSISGALVDRAGAPLPGIPGIVWGYSDNGGWARTRINPASGTYAVDLLSTDLNGSGGSSWALRARIDPTSGYIVQRPQVERVFLPFNEGAGSDLSGVDFELLAIESFGTLRGVVRNVNGEPLPRVRVVVRENSTSESAVERSDYTDRQGRYSLRVPGGTYTVRAHDDLGRPGPRQIEPAAIDAMVTARQSTTLDLRFRAADAVLSGIVAYEGAGYPALVRARSSDGATTHIRADASGSFTLPLLSALEWRIDAVSSDDDLFLRSAPISETLISDETRSVTLTLLAAEPLPESQAFVFAANEDQFFTMGDGSQVEVPAGAFAESGQALLTVRPLPELATVGDAQPVSFGYRLHAYHVDGERQRQPISRFLRPITLILPYTAAQLEALGITEEQLVPAYWDEASASWKAVEDVAVVPDGSGGTVQILTDHFTDYALLASITVPTQQTQIYLPLVKR